jgi:uncharacterized membrane protein YcaP (DUF421 family)
MWDLTLPWWHFVVRGLIVYVFIFVILRISGKKQIGQMSPFDLVLLLIISNAVQNAMNAGDNSVTAGLILAGSLVLFNLGIEYLSYRSRGFERIVEGEAKVLIHNGKVNEKTMREEKITKNELDEALRKQGVAEVKEVRFAILESDGQISVIKKKD